MTDALNNRHAGAERIASLAVLAAMGVFLGLSASDQSWAACILWGLVGGIAVVPVVIGAKHVARYVSRRRTP